MSKHHSSHHKAIPAPRPVVDQPPAEDDSLSLKSVATEVFRWVRAGIDLAEESPSFALSIVDDLQQAWRDSAKP